MWLRSFLLNAVQMNLMMRPMQSYLDVRTTELSRIQKNVGNAAAFLFPYSFSIFISCMIHLRDSNAVPARLERAGKSAKTTHTIATWWGVSVFSIFYGPWKANSCAMSENFPFRRSLLRHARGKLLYFRIEPLRRRIPSEIWQYRKNHETVTEKFQRLQYEWAAFPSFHPVPEWKYRLEIRQIYKHTSKLRRHWSLKFELILIHTHPKFCDSFTAVYRQWNYKNAYLDLQRCRFPVIFHFLHGKLLNVIHWKLVWFFFPTGKYHVTWRCQAMMLVLSPFKNKIEEKILKHRNLNMYFCSLIVDI